MRSESSDEEEGSVFCLNIHFYRIYQKQVSGRTPNIFLPCRRSVLRDRREDALVSSPNAGFSCCTSLVTSARREGRQPITGLVLQPRGSLLRRDDFARPRHTPQQSKEQKSFLLMTGGIFAGRNQFFLPSKRDTYTQPKRMKVPKNCHACDIRRHRVKNVLR